MEEYQHTEVRYQADILVVGAGIARFQQESVFG